MTIVHWAADAIGREQLVGSPPEADILWWELTFEDRWRQNCAQSVVECGHGVPGLGDERGEWLGGIAGPGFGIR